MHLACFVSFMTFHFFLNLDFNANIFPIRTLILISFIFFQKNSKICARQPAQMGLFQKKSATAMSAVHPESKKIVLSFFARGPDGFYSAHSIYGVRPVN